MKTLKIKSVLANLIMAIPFATIVACVPVGGVGSNNPTPSPTVSPTTSPSPISNWAYVGGIASITESEADYVSLAINQQTGLIAVGYQDQTNQGKLSVQGFQLNGFNWSYLGSPSGISTGTVNYVSLKASPDGNLAVAFKDLGSGLGKANVLHWNNTNWTPYSENGATVYPSDSSANYVSLAVPQNNIPYITYSNLAYTYLGLSYWATATWQINHFGNDVTPVSATFNQIAFVPNTNNPTMYLAFKDALNNNSVSVYSSNSPYDNAPSLVGPAGFTNNPVYYVSLVVNAQGIPYVAFEDGSSNNKLTVMSYSGGNWYYVGGKSGISNGQVSYVSLALDSNSNPYVAYQESSVAGKLIVKKYNVSTWNNVGSNNGISIGQANYISLQINPLNNSPVVAFQDGGLSNQLSVMQYNGQ